MNRQNRLEPVTTKSIWSVFADQLLKYIKRRVANNHDAEDLLQDIFVKIHNQSNALENVKNIQAWLYTITRNTITDYYRKTTHTNVDFDQIKNKPDFPETEQEGLTKFQICLDPFINQLREDEKKLLTEIKNGRSLKELAAEMNISYSSIKSKAHRARNHFRKKFRECCDIHLYNATDSELEYQQCKRC